MVSVMRSGMLTMFVVVAVASFLVQSGAAETTTITFDDYAAGTLIGEQYAASGVHFLNDGMAPYPRSSPTTRDVPDVISQPNALVNTYFDWELANSANVPMIIWFDRPMSAVQMNLSIEPVIPGHECSIPDAKVTAYNCQGTVVAEATSTPPESYVTVLDPSESISWIAIDYGPINCGEVIDDLTFAPGSGTCTDSSIPRVYITSHTDDQVVNDPVQVLTGKVLESGMLASLQLNGEALPFHKNSDTGDWEFTAEINLQDGANSLTVLAEDLSGHRGSANINLILGVPSTVSMDQFHITQRGVMHDTACDVDSPFVAGKSTLIRLKLSAQTETGANTYVSFVEMKIYRKGEGNLPDELIGTFLGTTYSPIVSMFNSPNDISAVHFWIQGDDFDQPGQYRFEFQPEITSAATPLGPPLVPHCGDSGASGEYFTFTETKNVDVLTIPIELTLNHPRQSPGSLDDITTVYRQLDKLLPIRDGYQRYPAWQTVNVVHPGVTLSEIEPLTLCDGVTTSELCTGTGFTWKFIDKDPSGLLRATSDTSVYGPVVPNNGCAIPYCDKAVGDLTEIGGMDTGWGKSTTYDPDVGIIRLGAGQFGCPYNDCNMFEPIVDDDHDGQITRNDYQHYIAEFEDSQIGWTNDLNFYDKGETYRFFQDLNQNQAFDKESEPVADITKRGYTFEGEFFPLGVNERIGRYYTTTSQVFRTGEIVFPKVIQNTYWGDGSGNWINLLNMPGIPNILAHEMGHKIGDLADGYFAGSPPQQISSLEPGSWIVYIGYDDMPASRVFSVMFDQGPDRIYWKDDYQKLFDVLEDPPARPSGLAAIQVAGEQFNLIATLTLKYELIASHISTEAQGSLTPEDPLSPFMLVFTTGSTSTTYPFAVNEPAFDPPASGGDNYLINVAAPLPEGTKSVELRRGTQTLGTWERSASMPTVHVLYPNGGESFGSDDTVTIRWESSDSDGGQLSFTVFYSNDVASGNWMVLGTGILGNELSWNTASTPGSLGSGSAIKVLTSDGFNNGEDQSDSTFQVSGKPPHAMIMSPVAGRQFLQYERIPLDGVVDDPEGQIAETWWTIDGTTVASELTVWVDSLTPGEHQVMLHTRDESGQTAIDQVIIMVLSDADADGMSDAFEDRYGLHPGNALDAASDDDGDGLMNFDEAWYGTDPMNPDTDGDGVNDGVEVAQGTDPATPPNRPPVANAGPDQQVTAGKDCQATVIFDGTGSSDPDNDALTYLWENSFGTITGESPAIIMPLGKQTVTLTVDDGRGGTDSDEVIISVSDKSPPVIQDLIVSPNLLWPANHKMVPVTIQLTAMDNCAKQVSCSITSIRSNEPENGLGEGDTAPDWGITGSLSAQLRAERSGKGSGRTYTLAVACSDSAGNSVKQEVTVAVPHDQGKQK